jgi:leader peptidase (prepilin peptidase)/N-methyltransferase
MPEIRPSPSASSAVHTVDDPCRDGATNGVDVRARRTGWLVGIGVSAAVWLTSGREPMSLALLTLFVPAAIAASYDVLERRLPDRWVLATAAGGLVAGSAITGSSVVTAWATGTLLALVPVLVLHLAAPAAMGFGDVKFAAALGGAVGVVGATSIGRAVLVMLALALASGTAVAYGTSGRRRAVVFGPCLLLGGSIAIALAMWQGAAAR